MALCAGCGEALPPQLANSTRNWTATIAVPGSPTTTAKVPDWNSEQFLSEWEELMRHLGAKYDGDPRLGYVDVGGFGNWGEWHNWPYEAQYPGPAGQTDITLANSTRMIRAVTTAFPKTFVLLNTTGSRLVDALARPATTEAAHFEWSNKLWQQALSLSGKIGVRNDCLGAGGAQQHALEGFRAAAAYAVAQGTPNPAERWRTAPFVTEYCNATTPGAVPPGEGTFQQAYNQVESAHVSLLSSDNYTGAFNQYSATEQDYFKKSVARSGYRYLYDRITAQVSSAQVLSLTATWRNVNVAPTYQNWKVTYEIAGDGWPPAATLTSAVDLRLVPPGATPIITDRIDLTTLWAGSYKVYLKVIDPSGYRTPMNLGIQGRDSQGRYLLGTVVLT